jgi:hypothetical protein
MRDDEIYISDLHLNESAKDEYMWDIFPWLKEQVHIHGVRTIKILGDITEKKDRHPSSVVNRIIRHLKELVAMRCIIVILKGNHDYVDTNNPFFGFINNHIGIQYIHKPYCDNPTSKHSIAYLPHSSNPDKDWADINFKECKTIFMHQGVEGCIYANQHESANGIPKTFFKDRGFKGKVYSGDIHVPQTVTDQIEYVGAPYSVRFGDHYRGRALLVRPDTKKVGSIPKSLYPDFLIKWSIPIHDVSDLDEYDICVGDRIKVSVTLDRVDVHKYKEICEEIKKFCEKREAELCGIKAKIIGEEQKQKVNKKRKRKDETDVEILNRFGSSEKLTEEQTDVGIEIIKELLEKV